MPSRVRSEISLLERCGLSTWNQRAGGARPTVPGGALFRWTYHTKRGRHDRKPSSARPHLMFSLASTLMLVLTRKVTDHRCASVERDRTHCVPKRTDTIIYVDRVS